MKGAFSIFRIFWSARPFKALKKLPPFNLSAAFQLSCTPCKLSFSHKAFQRWLWGSADLPASIRKPGPGGGLPSPFSPFCVLQPCITQRPSLVMGPSGLPPAGADARDNRPCAFRVQFANMRRSPSLYEQPLLPQGPSPEAQAFKRTAT